MTREVQALNGGAEARNGIVELSCYTSVVPANRTALRLAWAGLSLVMGAACTKTGTAWVSEPENSAALGGDSCDAAVGLGPCEASIDESALEPPESRRDDGGQQTLGSSRALARGPNVGFEPGRPRAARLTQTITLGEVEASAIEAPPAPSAAGPSVVVNNYAPRRRSIAGTAVVWGKRYRGQPFALAADRLELGHSAHGPGLASDSQLRPPFPYRTAPASPWQPATPPASGR